MSTPVSVFTGFLGSGKTTIIMNIIKTFPSEYKCAIIKNEFGQVETDSVLLKKAQNSNISVKEYFNGCVCCVLVGQLKNALLEIKEQYSPDRIILETSGSAFPAPIAWQINQMNDEGIHLDAILTVVDCINFPGYEDTSYTAKLQAQYTDCLLLNKFEEVNEREFDILLDKLNDLNLDTPKIKVHKDKIVSGELLFGIESKYQSIPEPTEQNSSHNNEVEVYEISTRRKLAKEIDDVEEFLKTLNKEEIYRVKGLLGIKDSLYLINFAFGRIYSTEINKEDVSETKRTGTNLTVVGVNLKGYISKIKLFFELAPQEIKTDS